MKKTKKIILISFLAFAILAISFPVIKRINIEIKEHFTYRNIKNLPNDNGLPRLYLKTNSGKLVLSKDYWFDGSYELFNNGKKINEGKTRIKGRGNTTWERPKKSYSLNLEKSTSLLGMSKDKRWVLLNPYNDKSLLRNDFALSLGKIYNNLSYTPNFRHIEVFINGYFFGVYQLTEKIKLSPERVNLAEGGYIIEKDRSRNKKAFITDKCNLAFVIADFDNKFYRNDSNIIYKQVQELEDAILTEDFNTYSKFLDIPSFIDWYIINELTKNHDAKMQMSVYLTYNPTEKKFFFGPLWDFDISCGNINYDNCDKTDGFWISDGSWIKNILKSDETLNMLKTRWNSTKDLLLFSINNDIQKEANYLNEAQKWNYKAWKTIGVNLWPNAVVPTTYQGEIDYLIKWLNERYSWCDKAFQQI